MCFFKRSVSLYTSMSLCPLRNSMRLAKWDRLSDRSKYMCRQIEYHHGGVLVYGHLIGCIISAQLPLSAAFCGYCKKNRLDSRELWDHGYPRSTVVSVRAKNTSACLPARSLVMLCYETNALPWGRPPHSTQTLGLSLFYPILRFR